ncbi:protein let-653 isoform X2 [Clupea harengus]|uniref:Protein let-653 isoform X2 n=1 Tax=Clupea harengus TaxID=7950 RepID=A0A6P8EYI9_CLUHA|nr:protein let-653 isoform X2 [Clupea harengus]
MNTMERLVALCTCLLLLPGVLVNIECPDVSLGTTRASPGITSSNITTGLNSTTTGPMNAMPMNTTKPQGPDTNQTTTNNSSTTPGTITRNSTTPPRPPSNTTAPRDLTSTTRQTPTSTILTTQGTTKTTKTPQTTKPVPVSGGSKAGYVLFFVIILVAVILLIICCLKKNKSRRYSVDLRNKHEDAVIPLSAVEADAVFDATPEKEMATFTAPETEPAALAPDPAGDPEPEKGETASGSREPLVSKQKPEKMDMVDLNGTEAAISTKTSMESLEDQLNDNNSNNYCTRANGGPAVGIVSKGGFYEILQSDPF